MQTLLLYRPKRTNSHAVARSTVRQFERLHFAGWVHMMLWEKPSECNGGRCPRKHQLLAQRHMDIDIRSFLWFFMTLTKCISSHVQRTRGRASGNLQSLDIDGHRHHILRKVPCLIYVSRPYSPGWVNVTALESACCVRLIALRCRRQRAWQKQPHHPAPRHRAG
jgi:hypothetical protein